MDDRDEALARQRFWLLQAMRLSGALMALFGAVVLSGRFIDMPLLGYGLLVLGAVEFFLVPHMVARNWRTPDR